MNLDDTIVAVGTPPGRGGIGVVRRAGPQARAIATPMLRLKHALEPGRAIFGELVEPSTGHVGTAALGCPGEQGSPDFPPPGTKAAELRSTGQPMAAVPTSDRIDEV